MKVLITGCTGMVGSALVEHLFQAGYSVQCLKRNPSKSESGFWDITSLPSDSDEKYHAVVHLAGENVATGRWSAGKKDEILSSRVDGTRELIDYISLLPDKPKVFLCASAVGYYGNRGDEYLDEQSSLGEGFLADVCRQWEQETHRLKDLEVRGVNLRFGMILSPAGGALHKMLPAFKMNAGGVIGNGQQYMSWISIRDVVSIIDFLITSDTVHGPVNVVSPEPVTNREFTKKLGKSLERSTFFTVPKTVVKLLFGQMGKEMLLTSSKVSPKTLLETGYEFRDRSLSATLDYCIKGV